MDFTKMTKEELEELVKTTTQTLLFVPMLRETQKVELVKQITLMKKELKKL